MCVSYTRVCFMCIFMCASYISTIYMIFVNIEHFLVPGTVGHTCNPRTLEAEAEGLS